VICYLRAGWACQFRDLPNGQSAIVDIYLPGDIIGLDMARPLNEVLTLTSVTVEKIEAENALIDLMTCRHTALYVGWLLNQRQRRADRRLVAMSCLDARGRLASMVLEFYIRLRRKRLITALSFNLPLTQLQIGNYLCLTVVHVNRVLRSLRDELIIEMGKHCVTILDLERLKCLAQLGATKGKIADIGKHPISAAAD
jgi:CRP/FNR family transcriptional regulator, anaerobic regulatory protein